MVQGFLPCVSFGLWQCIFKLFLLQKNSQNSVENCHIGKKIKLVLKTTYKVFFSKIPAWCKVSFIVFGLGNEFWAIFTPTPHPTNPPKKKNNHNLVENDGFGKKTNYTISENYPQGFPKISAQWKVFFIVFGPRECHFRLQREKKKVCNPISEDGWCPNKEG